MPVRPISISASAQAWRIGISAAQALKLSPPNTLARGGATPACTSLPCTSGLVAHCRNSQAAGWRLEWAEIATVQPIATGFEMPVSLPGGSTFTPRSLERFGKRMMLANSFELSWVIATRPWPRSSITWVKVWFRAPGGP